MEPGLWMDKALLAPIAPEFTVPPDLEGVTLLLKMMRGLESFYSSICVCKSSDKKKNKAN